MDDETLAQLGDMASKAAWRTPLYKTYGLSCDEQEKYNRLNDIAIGRSLLLLIDSSEIRDVLKG